MIGVPDRTWGEVPIAVIELRDGAVADSDELRSFITSSLAEFKVPREVWFEALPRTSTGKLKSMFSARGGRKITDSD